MLNPLSLKKKYLEFYSWLFTITLPPPPTIKLYNGFHKGQCEGDILSISFYPNEWISEAVRLFAYPVFWILLL